MENFFSDASNIISLVSLILSFSISSIALGFSIKNMNLQNRVNALDEKIKQIELDRIKAEQERESQFAFNITNYKVKNAEYKLRFTNVGKPIMYNVNLEIEEEQPEIINTIMPYEMLAQYDHFEESILCYLGTSKKFHLVITWENEKGEKFNENRLCSLDN